MKLANDLYLVGSGGIGISNVTDGNVYLIDGHREIGLIDTGSGVATGRILENIRQEGFDLEKLNALPNIRKNAIKYFLDYLKEKPLIAFVFGSTAKGTFKEDSDIDIFIITNSKINTEEAEKHAEALTGIRISTFQMRLEPFLKEIKLKEDPVIQSAIASGYPVLNNLYYYEILYNGP